MARSDHTEGLSDAIESALLHADEIDHLDEWDDTHLAEIQRLLTEAKRIHDVWWSGPAASTK